ncbi:amidohydrolase [Leekyejoonella antrihumi]|uniref:Amidohydrolase n=1 Tax=Leekyejoonella antrihumi TaxID=1660198 RepID=A0A563E9Q4_9MICO|nr:amidohydrolase [Leekyejoonella antrihumi]TWP38534.1 amidohydrolase [Leekyejoonella antrihumi]
MTDDLLTHVDDVLPWHVNLYEDLHRNPELSFQETRTSGLVADRLRNLGYTVHTGIGGTGLVGVLVNGPGSVVLARADMDGLPVREESGLPYASTTTATDPQGRQVPVMHACGHDMHISCLLATAQLLAEHRADWSGTFIALFQPAEELVAGAQAMVDDGLADLIPKPDVALGQHVMGLPYDTVASRPGAALSASDSIKVTVHGRGTHGSMPHLGIDPILLGSAIVLRLNAIVSRELAPGHFGVVTVGSFQSGTKSNIIPGSAELLLNLRSYNRETRSLLRAAVERVVRAECDASGCSAPPEFDDYQSAPLTQNSPEVHNKVFAAFANRFGDKAVLMEPSTGSEDFSDIPNALGVPYLFWIWGGFDPDTYRTAEADGTLSTTIPGNHASTFAPVMEPTMRTGIEAMTTAVMSYLAKDANNA